MQSINKMTGEKSHIIFVALSLYSLLPLTGLHGNPRGLASTSTPRLPPILTGSPFIANSLRDQPGVSFLYFYLYPLQKPSELTISCPISLLI